MKVLITAGATWVKVDKVRIFTSQFTGRTGLCLARRLEKKGHSVTLLVNPHCLGDIRDVKVVYYRYFDEFKKAVVEILKSGFYDVIIHTAAVSDYKVKNVSEIKIPSGRKHFTLQLIPAEKIIKKIRTLAKKSLLIQFKLEVKRKRLIETAYESLKKNKADFVVANAVEDLAGKYKRFIISRHKDIVSVESEKSLAGVLDKIINTYK